MKQVSKYDNIDWQIFRSRVKGKKVILEDKLYIIRSFFEKNKYQNNYYRIINWLIGLKLGYKAAKNEDAIKRIEREIESYGLDIDYEFIDDSNKTDNILKDELNRYSFEERKILWNDLYKTNSIWLKNGYVHPGINRLMKLLFIVFESNNEDIVKIRQSLNRIKYLKIFANGIRNTHKFLF